MKSLIESSPLESRLQERSRRTPRLPLSLIATIVQSYARARFELRGTRRGARVRCHGRVLVDRSASVSVGQRAVFLGGSIPTELRCASGAELTIGARTLFNYGVSVVAHDRVHIGERCMLASLVHVRDDDGRRVEPVHIGDDVWIAYGAIVEPGATIGDGAVIGTMAVVTGVVPPKTLVTGNPGRCFPLESKAMDLGLAAPAPGLAASSAQPRPSAHRPLHEEVRAAIVEWLDDSRLFGEAASLLVDDALSLPQQALLDSLGLVELVMELEKRFGVTINRNRIADPASQSMNDFVELVAGAADPSLEARR